MSKASAAVKTFQADALPVRIYSNPRDLAVEASAMARAEIERVLRERGSVRIILATGNSQIEFLNLLMKESGIDWSRITLFHMDEYLGLSAGHPASFRRYMREKVEARIRPAAFHYLEGDADEPIKECDRYGKLLQAAPIDLCCLGMGENGHLAFNDPPVADFNDPRPVKIVKLDSECRRQQATEGHFPSLEAVPAYALTLTIPVLCGAKKMLCLAPEKRKAVAVRAALLDPISVSCPASVLRRQAHATLLLDLASASLL